MTDIGMYVKRRLLLRCEWNDNVISYILDNPQVVMSWHESAVFQFVQKIRQRIPVEINHSRNTCNRGLDHDKCKGMALIGTSCRDISPKGQVTYLTLGRELKKRMNER